MSKYNVSLGLSIFAVALSVLAICIAVYRTPELGFDYMGVIVGVQFSMQAGLATMRLAE